MRHIVCHRNAAAVVTPTHRLDHHRGADTLSEGVDFVKVVKAFDSRVPGHRDIQRRQPPTHDELVLGVPQGPRRRRHIDPFGDQLLHQLGRHVLVVEGQHVGSGGNAAQVVKVGVRTDHHVGGDLRSRIVGGGGQHAQRLPERDRGLMGHPSKLTAADHRYLGAPPACGGRAA